MGTYPQVGLAGKYQAAANPERWPHLCSEGLSALQRGFDQLCSDSWWLPFEVKGREADVPT